MIDPGYAAAWNSLGGLYKNQTNLGLQPVEEGHALAREAVNKALAIDPEYAPAHARLSGFSKNLDYDLVAAVRHLEHALQLEPANTGIIGGAASLIFSLGRLDEAVALTEFLVARDPVNPDNHNALGVLYTYAGRWDEAIDSFNTVLTLSPDYILGQHFIGQALLLKGELQTALEVMESEDSPISMIGLAMVYHSLGRTDESDAALADLIEQHEQSAAYNIAFVLAWRGEADRAFEWLDKAVEYKDVGMSAIVSDKLFSNIHDDPCWLPFLESIGRSPEQLAAIEFKVTLPE